MTKEQAREYAKNHNLYTLNDEDFAEAEKLGDDMKTEYMHTWHADYVHYNLCDSRASKMLEGEYC